jgi:hypothetical protein
LKNATINLVLVILLFISGCLKNPFASRHSETPAGITGTWETPAAPETVIRNLLNAYNEKVPQNYSTCLANNFVFSAPEDSIRNTGQGYGDWDRNVEIRTAENIFSVFNSPGKHLDLGLIESASNPDSIGDTAAVLYRNYIVRIVVADTLGADTTIAKGLATFRLNQAELNLWSIYFWQDLPDTVGGYDWGQFKAMYRQ